MINNNVISIHNTEQLRILYTDIYYYCGKTKRKKEKLIGDFDDEGFQEPEYRLV